jgi:ABC-type Fe3+ transport system permease subunit
MKLAIARPVMSAAFVLVIGLVTLAPVLYVVVTSFNVAPIEGSYEFGFGAWHDIFASAKTWSAIVYTFILALRVPVAVVLAFGIAWLIVRVGIPGHRFIELAFWFGFLLPVFPMMMGWILLLDEHYGLLNALSTSFSRPSRSWSSCWRR